MKAFSKIIRRVHMYLALFLAPWMLMYALSTAVMNHREFFKERYGGTLVRWEKEREQVVKTRLPADTPARALAGEVLLELGLRGNFSGNWSKDHQTLTAFRADPISPRRITYTPADGKAVIEKQEFRSQPFLERLHRRRGYQSPFLADKLWGGMVDLAIVAMVFWALSGLWMWWELKPTRGLGAICGLAGAGLFLFFLFRI